MEGDVAVATEARKVLPRLEDAAFVTRGHDRDNRDWPVAGSVERSGEGLGRDDPFRVDASFVDAAWEGSPDRYVDGGVFDGGKQRDSVGRGRCGKVSGEEVVGGSGARRKHDPAGIVAAEQVGEPFAAVGEEVTGRRGHAKEARGIRPKAIRGLEPCGAGGGVERRGGVVVEVGHGVWKPER